jgi:pimeloyl-ACP methyl ester carboxylesterase
MSTPLSCLKRPSARPNLTYRVLLYCLLPCVAIAWTTATWGAERRADGEAAKRRVADEDLPAPYDISGSELTTQDGVALKASFFPSKEGKEAVPIILLHGLKGSRKDYGTLAVALHREGHAVLVPDLRGHGAVESSGSRFGPAEFNQMVQFDMETLKSFLIKKNNAGELNIEKLCIVGADMGASVALNWALLDWSWPQYPGVKQGQHVKALVLLSPERRFKGIGVEDALKNPLLNRFVSIFILFGNDEPKVASQVKLLHTTLSRLHPEPDEENAERDKTLFLKGFDTKAQGTKLFDPRLNLGVEARIEKFIELRLVAKEYPWAETGKKSGKSASK